MKSKIGVTVLFLFFVATTFLLASYFLKNSWEKGVDQTFLLPNDFKGCVLILYNIEAAPPLQIDNNEIIYRVPKDGIVYTSSPQDFGWVNKKHSGWYVTRAFYVDENGNRVKEVPQDEIRFGANGSFSKEGRPDLDYFYQIFSSNEFESGSCPPLDSMQWDSLTNGFG